MERNVGIWLDVEKAYIISLRDDNVRIDKIKSEVETRLRFRGETKSYSRMGNMLVNPQKRITHRKKHQLKHFFEEIAKKISDANEIYLFGPADTKIHMAKYLNRNLLFGSKIRKVESEDHLTKNQMIARVKSVFSEKPVKVRERSYH